MREIDIILTVGMGIDIKGILEKYKEANPKGVIVAVAAFATHFSLSLPQAHGCA